MNGVPRRATIRWWSSSSSTRSANVLCPADQALEHRLRCQHDARSRQPDGRLRHHRGLPRLPGSISGWTRSSRLLMKVPEAVQRRQLSRHHDQRAVPGPDEKVDRGVTRNRFPPPGHRSVHAGHGHAALAVDARPSAEGHRRDSARNSTRAPAMASPSHWPTRCAGCSRQRYLIDDVLELEAKGAGQSRPWPRAFPDC